MSIQRNPQTLGIERRPANPVPKDFNPGGSRYKVQDGDDWESVAKRFNVDVRTLIYFNFHTNNPDEVNWYLNRNVGCNKPTPDGFNWKFSSSANPGFIFIPVSASPVSASPERPPERPEPNGRNKLARWLDNLPDVDEEFDWGYVSFALDLVEFAHVATALLAPEIVVEFLSLEIAGPIAGAVAFWLELGAAHKEAIDKIKRDYAFRGLSIGMVLGANGARNSYIKWNFENITVRNAVYPEQNTNFEKAYRAGLWSGVVYGRQLNRRESGKLFKILQSKMGWNFDHDTKPWEEWSDLTKKQYYEDAAAAFRASFIRG